MTTTTTLYVSRRIRIPSFAAAAAFDELAAATSPTCEIVAPTAVLVMRCPLVAADDVPTLPVRATTGSLRPAAGWGSFPVEVDLVPWSSREAAVGVRPAGRWVPLTEGRRQHRFVRLADAMAAHVAGRLEARATAWELDVVREAAALLGTAVGT